MMGEGINKPNTLGGNIKLILGSLIFIVVTFFGMLFIDAGLRVVGIQEHLAGGIARIGVAVLILWLFVKRHNHIVVGLGSKGLGSGFLLGWLALIAAGINFYETFANIKWEYALTPTGMDYLGYIIFVLGIGVFEEVLLRGIILNKMVDRWGTSKKGIYSAVLISSLLFGIWHMINLIARPWLIVSTIIQVIYAFFIGAFFCGVYLRTKNLWSVILLHAIFDLGGCLDELFIKQVTEKVIQDISIGAGLIILVEFSLFLIVGLIYLRKVKVEEVYHQAYESMEVI